MIWVAVAVGGALGSAARHAVNAVFVLTFSRPVPFATATVNLVGSLVIGWLAGRAASGRLDIGQPLRAFLFIGVLGGFTTFSSFMLDTMTLAEEGSRALAVSNVVGQTAIGIGAVYLGYYFGLRP